MRAETGAGPESGFTLLELIAAIVIAALVLGATYRLLATGLAQLGAGEARLTAALHAQSLLAELDGDGPAVPGEREGTLADGFAYRLLVQPYDEVPATGGLSAYLVEVTVTPPGAAGVTLTTLRLGEASP
jgi:general secretion pathway protein I